MSFLKYSDLGNESFFKASFVNESLGRVTGLERKVFLSYRHQDKNKVRPVAEFLKKLGVNIYVDYLDDTLPQPPTITTANALRSQIQGSDKFMVMATPNSTESKWIPWELGLGDSCLGHENCVVLPLVLSDSWTPELYYGLYGYVENKRSLVAYGISTDNWKVVYANGSSVSLIDWFKK